jgi:hypothetical protein
MREFKDQTPYVSRFEIIVDFGFPLYSGKFSALFLFCWRREAIVIEVLFSSIDLCLSVPETKSFNVRLPGVTTELLAQRSYIPQGQKQRLLRARIAGNCKFEGELVDTLYDMPVDNSIKGLSILISQDGPPSSCLA